MIVQLSKYYIAVRRGKDARFRDKKVILVVADDTLIRPGMWKWLNVMNIDTRRLLGNDLVPVTENTLDPRDPKKE